LTSAALNPLSKPCAHGGYLIGRRTDIQSVLDFQAGPIGVRGFVSGVSLTVHPRSSKDYLRAWHPTKAGRRIFMGVSFNLVWADPPVPAWTG